ncbi:hypothetical protein AYI69_g10366 [Smittium culicis]|uniref:Uncharacterized protein n=1 Tax=Smittium culicis TaxID=133412 RepID=A0A1R1X6C4_9FUNG|nr:hypothetical protein AYI69_g10366 [Smittium culicis]
MQLQSSIDSVLTVNEIALKFSEGIFEHTTGVFDNSKNTPAPSSSRAFKGRIRVVYTGYFFNVYVDGESKISRTIENSTITQILVAPLQGQASISNGVVSCYGGNCQEPSTTRPSTSSVAPPTTSAAAPPANSAVAPSSYSTVSSKSCDSISPFNDFLVVSKPFIKMYDLSRPILVPCASSDFQLDFDVATESDLYVTFSDASGLSSGSGYVESFFGFSSGNYFIKRAQFNGNDKSTNSVTQPSYSGHLTINYTNGILSLYVSNEFEASFKIRNLDLKKVYITPHSGVAKISNGTFACSSVIKC